VGQDGCVEQGRVRRSACVCRSGRGRRSGSVCRSVGVCRTAGACPAEGVVEASDRVDVDPGLTQGVQLLLLALRVRYQVLDVVGGAREHGRTASDLRMVDQGDDPPGACGHGPARVGAGEGRCRQAEVRGQAVAGRKAVSARRPSSWATVPPPTNARMECLRVPPTTMTSFSGAETMASATRSEFVTTRSPERVTSSFANSSVVVPGPRATTSPLRTR